MISIANGNAVRAMYLYRQEALNESIGVCTNNLAQLVVIIWTPNSRSIAIAAKFGLITCVNRKILFFAGFN